MNGLGIFGHLTLDYMNPVYGEDHGSPVLTWPDKWQQVAGCDMQSPQTGSNTDNRLGTEYQYTLYMPFNSPLQDNARVRYMGQELQIVGAVQHVDDPLGLIPYDMALVKEWNG